MWLIIGDYEADEAPSWALQYSTNLPPNEPVQQKLYVETIRHLKETMVQAWLPNETMVSTDPVERATKPSKEDITKNNLQSEKITKLFMETSTLLLIYAKIPNRPL